MLDYTSYWRKGDGLHSSELKNIEDAIIENGVKNIVEFGSGKSTEFLADLRKEKNLDYTVHSFDHHPEYCYKGEHDFLVMQILDLVSCSDAWFDDMFKNGKYNRLGFNNCQHAMNVVDNRNGFYDMTEDCLPDNIDLVILDGPNGNGRSIAYLHIKDKISDNCTILIDDSDHYDFIPRCDQIFNTEIIVHGKDKTIHPLFSYAMLKISPKT